MKSFWLSLLRPAVHWTDNMSSNCQGCSCDDYGSNPGVAKQPLHVARYIMTKNCLSKILGPPLTCMKYSERIHERHSVWVVAEGDINAWSITLIQHAWSQLTFTIFAGHLSWSHIHLHLCSFINILRFH